MSPETANRRYPEFVKTMRLGLVLRILFAVFILAICLLLRKAELLEFNPWLLITIILIELLINYPWTGIIARIKTLGGLKGFSLTHIVIDIIAVSLCIYVVGGVGLLNLAYFFLILWAGFFLSARACYVTAGASALAYATVLGIQYLQELDPPTLLSSTKSLSIVTLYLVAGLGHAACLILVAYFGAKSAELLVSNQRAEQQQVVLKADLDHTVRQLVRSEKMAATGELAAGMAHEIYNPLTAIAGMAEATLLNPNGGSSRVTETLRAIKSEAERAGAVVRRLLGFAKPAEPQLNSCQLNDVIAEALSMVRYQVDLGRIQAETALDPDLPTIVADHEQLREACANLLLNAVQAMPEGGRLTIETRRAEPHHVQLRISDTGCGIPASHLSRIFDPFFTTKPTEHNHGLGLSVTHSIVQRHCGSIDVQSQVGHGSTFTLTLPINLKQTSNPHEQPAATVIDLARSMASPSILVVDDDQAVCQMLAQFLLDQGYQVTTAHSGLEALTQAQAERPDLILLDLRMPGMDGIECLRELKARTPQIPVIVATAMDDETIAGRCLEIGAAEYLIKPVSLEYLKTAIHTHVMAQRSRPRAKAQ